MEWHGQNAARDKGEWLLSLIEEASALPAPYHFVPARELKDSEGVVVATVTGLRDAVAQLKAVGRPTGLHAGLPGSKAGSCGNACLERISKVERWAWEAKKDTTVVIRRVEDAELHAQRKIPEQFGGVEEE